MSERARHFPERGAVKPRPVRCAAASVCEAHKDPRCIAHALRGGEWCWAHQKRIDEGSTVKRFTGGAL